MPRKVRKNVLRLWVTRNPLASRHFAFSALEPEHRVGQARLKPGRRRATPPPHPRRRLLDQPHHFPLPNAERGTHCRGCASGGGGEITRRLKPGVYQVSATPTTRADAPAPKR